MSERDIRDLERSYSEAKIQHTCVEWYRHRCMSWFKDDLVMRANPRVMLYAVPNGGERTARSAAMRKYEGEVAGVSDLIFQSSSRAGDYKFLAIEMKAGKGCQSDAQKEWERTATAFGGKYVVCRSIIDFCKTMCEYLHLDYNEELSLLLRQYPSYLQTRVDVDETRKKVKRTINKFRRYYGKRLDQD